MKKKFHFCWNTLTEFRLSTYIKYKRVLVWPSQPFDPFDSVLSFRNLITSVCEHIKNVRVHQRIDSSRHDRDYKLVFMYKGMAVSVGLCDYNRKKNYSILLNASHAGLKLTLCNQLYSYTTPLRCVYYVNVIDENLVECNTLRNKTWH